ncbi:MAG: formate dehydrogenase accessory sulfurtransferase FdhD [Acidobacteriota bacterium]|nr:formate dehydrogenase accessory sulfurtransferase FdhD [Acidobacteriota bacterium]
MTTPRAVTAVRAIKVRPGRSVELPEHLATEEPMQIRVAGPGQEAVALAVTMRTPGHDFELAAGFVVTEAVAAATDIVSVDYCQATEITEPEARFNHVTVRLGRIWQSDSPARSFAASSSCGTCGKTTIDQVDLGGCGVPPGAPFAGSLVPGLPDDLRRAQKTFERTGGLHAAGLFTRGGEMVLAREDVGRHNAVDKVVGAMVLGRVSAPGGDHLLTVSGRVSFEIVQKAAAAGIAVIVAVSAPSSLAVSAAERLGITVAGFVRNGGYNIYSHPERIDLDA